MTATSIYYYDVSILSRIASLVGEKDAEEKYSKLAKEIKESFNLKYFDKDKLVIDRDSQTANAMPLYVGLIDKEYEDDILRNLVRDIESRGNSLTAGDVGYRYVLQALESGGRSDVIYDMNSRYDVPGYGWQLAHGATSLTESWQAYGFVSNNHFMLGHLMEWLFSGLGGIRQSESSVGFKHIIIDPQITGDITHAKTSYESPYGTIRCEWKKDDGKYSLRVSIPSNCTATAIVPETDPSKIFDFGVRITEESDVRTSASPRGTSIAIGSGEYLFTMEDK